MPRWTVLALAAIVLAGCGSSRDAAPSTAPSATATLSQLAPSARTVRKLDVRITADTHLPKVGTPWRYTVRATADGKPVNARISVRVLYQGTQVADLGTHDRPNGVWSGTFTWPQVARAHALFVEVKAMSRGRVGSATYQVAGQ